MFKRFICSAILFGRFISSISFSDFVPFQWKKHFEKMVVNLRMAKTTLRSCTIVMSNSSLELTVIVGSSAGKDC